MGRIQECKDQRVKIAVGMKVTGSAQRLNRNTYVSVLITLQDFFPVAIDELGAGRMMTAKILKLFIFVVGGPHRDTHDSGDSILGPVNDSHPS